jgi:hypothetical protein
MGELFPQVHRVPKSRAMPRHLADVSESAGKIHLSFRLACHPDPAPCGYGHHIGVKITERSFPEAASSNIMA